ncbi:AT-rich interactive domain-containing protein 4-like [Ipomoea triloba]|uniref:AT-rich interactive domain-containing protein 4-like n=1 Tax=Ipomoea triloba TaxID=35885 RepID=UPI00125D2D96|nr:AT-rich interactive domain-containing protein 4-like [Ipomoea triloba]
MCSVQGTSKNCCSLLGVVCGRATGNKHQQDVAVDGVTYPFPEIASSGRLEVHLLKNPSRDEFRTALDTLQPNIVFLQGEQLPNDEVGSLVWEGLDLSSEEAISGLFGAKLPTTVYLELANGEKLATALHSMGIPYVIYWKNTFSRFAACHFRHALFSVVQSSSCVTWDAFQLAQASFRLYCVQNNLVSSDNSRKVEAKIGPQLLGDPPKIDAPPPEPVAGDDEESPSDDLPAINIYDDDTNIRFLICGLPCSLDTCLLESLEDGLNALLSIEIRGSKLHNRVSALPPPLQASAFSRGVVTMRCDVSTSSSAHISLLVSGSAQTCFDDQLLENHIKSEIIEKSQLVHGQPSPKEIRPPLSDPWRSASIACGATVFEVCMRAPMWALQVLRQLASDFSFRSFVALGIASIQGLAVASFEKEDAERLLFFCKMQGKDGNSNDVKIASPPAWLRPPAPSRKRSRTSHETDLSPRNGLNSGYRAYIRREEENGSAPANGYAMPLVPARRKLKAAALKPIPHVRHQKMFPFSGISEVEGHDGNQVKANLPVVPSTKAASNIGVAAATQRKAVASSQQAKQIIPLNPLPLKKHGCERSPIHVCSEEEFLKDVMQFLILRGHTRLIPQGGLPEFPDAVLNAKRLDLFNLYREVVSRGGFHVGNGINWKGQVFSKMRNHTVTNRMTGVGNTLKRHYETYLLEYELAHDDVDGECCLLCHSSAAGDWVNCGMCGEWAHFGCDRRPGLGAFKDYAKTDGLEYLCPQCSVAKFKKKIQKIANGYS